MNYKTVKPSSFLEPFVRYFWILDITNEDLPFAQHLIPYGRLELFFYLNQPLFGNAQDENNINRKDGIFTGFFEESMYLNHYAPFRAAGISFQPWAGSEIFQIPANNFTNKSTPFSDIDPTSRLKDHILASKTEDEIYQCFEKYLVNKLKAIEIDKVSAFISQEILKNPIDNKLYGVILPQIGLSKRRIEQRFLNSVGVTMGFFNSMSRFEKSLELMAIGHKQSLTSIGFNAGYYDQSHFIREFRRFAQTTPSSILKDIKAKSDAELNFMLE